LHPENKSNINTKKIDMETTEKFFQEIEKKMYVLHKEILTFSEACIYLGLSKSCLYKLTSSNSIPYFKPHGKLVYFEKEELNNWLRSNPVMSAAQAEEQALTYINRKNLGI